ncbi:MAG: hypothetical protein HZB41_04300 [Ignavibacteriae bacterium]|nr:hypothetical protein [Ignavibacteriota bacterium]
MKRIKYNIAVIALVVILFIIPGCSGDIIPPPPPKPDLIVEITGYDSLHYEAVASGINNNDAHQLQLSSFTTINGKYYNLTISFFFPLDSTLKAGTYNFRSQPNSLENNVVGGFFIGKGENEIIFTSDSGTAVISSINGLVIDGTINFYATDNSKQRHIIVNGTINKN